MNAKIAIPFSEGQVFPHFGKASQFKLYTIENDQVTASEVLSTDGQGHEDLALWLVFQGVNAVLCGNIGPGAQGALVGAGIVPLAGVSGAADEAVRKLLDGTLETVQGATCGGHGGGCGGNCGHCGHGCGHSSGEA